MGGLPARQIRAPVLGQIQLAVDESMGKLGDVREEDADLAVFHAPGTSAILGADASGVVSAFGKSAFINDEHREDLSGSLRSR
jgi:hypothetical protein